MANGRWLIVGLMAVTAGSVTAVADKGDARAARHVLVVYNDQEPESLPLAEYYARRRGVPTNQLCRISVRPAETITRLEFENDVRQPLARFLTSQQLWQPLVWTGTGLPLERVGGVEIRENSIDYVVLVYGVPLRIESDPALQGELPSKLPESLRRNEAAVDSELALLPEWERRLTGPVRNPFHRVARPRFGPPLNRQMLIVARLDGPDPQTVRRMIDDACAVEQAGGLRGRAYFDLRSITDPGYVIGDDWLRRAALAVAQAGFECVVDEQPPTWPAEFPMPDAALYAGWYMPNAVGPFRRADFRFNPGAIAYHLHSASGASVRTRAAYWVGPLLDKGAAATMGCVYEPYLTMTPHLDRFFQALLGGATFGEAAYWSQPVLSWQITVVGDPLYRPFPQP